jgi:4-alpha-glucanotransferase
MPGANERPNWCLTLPVPVEELAAHPGVQTVARVLAEGLAPAPKKKKATRRSKK